MGRLAVFLARVAFSSVWFKLYEERVLLITILSQFVLIHYRRIW